MSAVLPRRTSGEGVATAARSFALGWMAVVAAAVALQWFWAPPRPTPAAALMALLGFVACARPVRLGGTLELSAAQPIAFAALLVWDTSTGLVVGGACALGAVLMRRPGLGALRGAFNVAVGAGAVLGAGRILALAGGGSGAGALEPETMVALALATLVAFPLGTLPVAGAVALHTGGGFWSLWIRRYGPTAPGFLAASGLALLLVVAAQTLGAASLVFYVPLAALIFTRTLPRPASPEAP